MLPVAAAPWAVPVEALDDELPAPVVELPDALADEEGAAVGSMLITFHWALALVPLGSNGRKLATPFDDSCTSAVVEAK